MVKFLFYFFIFFYYFWDYVRDEGGCWNFITHPSLVTSFTSSLPHVSHIFGHSCSIKGVYFDEKYYLVLSSFSPISNRKSDPDTPLNHPLLRLYGIVDAAGQVNEKTLQCLP